MQYKKVVKILGIAIASTLTFSGCTYVNSQPCLYGPAPIESDWEDSEEEISSENLNEKITESKNMQQEDIITNKKSSTDNKVLEETNEEIINTTPNLESVESDTTKLPENNLEDNSFTDGVIVCLYGVEVPDPQPTIEPCLYGPAPIDNVEPPITVLYGVLPVEDEIEPVPLLYGPSPVIVEEPHILLYGPYVAPEPEPEIEEDFEINKPQPIIEPCLYGPAPKND